MTNTFVGVGAYPRSCGHCAGGDLCVDVHAGDLVCRGCGSVLRDKLAVDDRMLQLGECGGDVTRFRGRAGGRAQGDFDLAAAERGAARPPAAPAPAPAPAAAFGAAGPASLFLADAAAAAPVRAATLAARAERYERKRRAALDALEQLAARLVLPRHVLDGARGALCAAPPAALDAAFAAARRKTGGAAARERGAADAGGVSGAVAVVHAARKLGFPLSLREVAAACADERASATSTGRAVAAFERALRRDDAEPEARRPQKRAKLRGADGPGAFVARARARFGADALRGCGPPPDDALRCGQVTEGSYWAQRKALVAFLATGRDARPAACAAELADRLAKTLPAAVALAARPKVAAAALYLVAEAHGPAVDDDARKTFLLPALAAAARCGAADGVASLVRAVRKAAIAPRSLDFDLAALPSPVSVSEPFDERPRALDDEPAVVDWTPSLLRELELEPPPL